MGRKPRRVGLSTLKKKAWELLSKAIRLESRERDGLVSCVTCGRRKRWKEMQAGHFISGRVNSILFDERGIHPQCSGCNCIHHGRVLEYRDYMLQRYGEAVIDELRANKNIPRTFSADELTEMIAGYQERVQAEIERRGEL